MLYKVANKLTNTLKEEQQSTDPYPWLGEGDDRSLADRDILKKYIDLETSCITQKEKEE